MKEAQFNYEIADSQGTIVEPLKEFAEFDADAYAEYEAGLRERNHAFWESDSGVAVYRRFRVPAVFSYGCKDMEWSLKVQLAALNESMKYKADIANFLEPWYGIGIIASALGIEYKWPEGQAPAMKAIFKSVDEALAADVKMVEETGIGKHTLEMIEYFLEHTGGKVGMSLTDTQSAMNAASFLIETNTFYMSFYDNSEGLKKLLGRLNGLLIDFTKQQQKVIGEALVWPGHGFASSREFCGLGMSDDVMTMLNEQQYKEFEVPYMEQAGEQFGGAVFHSCGNWSKKIEAVKAINNLQMVDGAFSAETDPDANLCEPVSESFANSEVVVNARIVGNPDVIENQVRKLWRDGMKLIVVTYCDTPEEQKKAYERIHNVCGV